MVEPGGNFTTTITNLEVSTNTSRESTTWPTVSEITLGDPFDGYGYERASGVPPWVVYLLCAIAAFACLGLFLFIYFWGFAKSETRAAQVITDKSNNQEGSKEAKVVVSKA